MKSRSSSSLGHPSSMPVYELVLTTWIRENLPKATNLIASGEYPNSNPIICSVNPPEKTETQSDQVHEEALQSITERAASILAECATFSAAHPKALGQSHEGSPRSTFSGRPTQRMF